jgi:hypothetical protein
MAALLNLLNGQLTTVFYAKGLPQLHRRSVALMAAIMLLMIYPCAKLMGVVGGQVACLIAVFFGYILQLERVHRITALDLRQYARPMLFSALLSVGVVALCLSTRLSAVPLRPFGNIVVGFMACFAAYVVGGAIFLRNTGQQANRTQF